MVLLAEMDPTIGEEKRIEIKGLVESVCSKKDGFIYLTIREGDSRLEVEFPFEGGDFEFAAVNSTLLDKVVAYEKKLLPKVRRNNQGYDQYTLEILGGPLSGNVFRKTTYT